VFKGLRTAHMYKCKYDGRQQSWGGNPVTCIS